MVCSRESVHQGQIEGIICLDLAAQGLVVKTLRGDIGVGQAVGCAPIGLRNLDRRLPRDIAPVAALHWGRAPCDQGAIHRIQSIQTEQLKARALEIKRLWAPMRVERFRRLRHQVVDKFGETDRAVKIRLVGLGAAANRGDHRRGMESVPDIHSIEYEFLEIGADQPV